MPILSKALTEVATHIVDPVCRQIIEKMLHQLDIKRIIEDSIIIKTKYSSISDTSDTQSNAMLRTSRIVANTTLQQNPNSVKWDISTFSNTLAFGAGSDLDRRQPTFYDTQLNVRLYEHSAPCNILMQVDTILLDKSDAYALPSKLFNTFREGSVYQLSDIIFDYKLPDDIVGVLGAIYNMKRYTRPFETFYEYLQYWSNGKISMNKSRHSDRPELVMKVHISDCLMSVEYSDDEPTPENTDSSVNSFVVPFTVTLQFALPNTNLLVYPIIIENNLIPISYIPIPVSLRNRTSAASVRDLGIDAYYQTYANPRLSFARVPFYDDWVAPLASEAASGSQNPFFVACCLLDEDLERNVIDLNGELGDGFYLPDEIKTIIRRQEEIQPNCTFARDALIGISVYYGEEQLPINMLTFDNDLVLSYKGRRLNHPYHLVLSELGDIDKLNPNLLPIIEENITNINPLAIRQFWWWLIHGKVNFTPAITEYISKYHYDKRTGHIIDKDTKEVIAIIDGQLSSWTDKNGTFVPGTYTKLGDTDAYRVIARIFNCEILCFK